MLDAKTIAIVQADWAKVLPIAETAADLFYDKLFLLDPAVKPLFKTDLKEQKKKLLMMLGAAVKGLDDLNALVPTVQSLGKRHAGYGVKAEHYGTVGAALLGTLEAGLGSDFGLENKAAWTAVYGVLSSTMQAAAGAA